MLILQAFIRVIILLGKTALKNICVFVALNDLSHVIYPLLVDTKPLYILIIGGRVSLPAVLSPTNLRYNVDIAKQR